MLKLLKYELVGSYRQYLTSFSVYILLCLATPFLPDKISGFFMGLVMVAVAGITMSIFINVIIQYTKSMFGRPGYLTLTLPVSSKQLVASKLIGATIWSTLASVILFIGVGILLFLSANISISDIFMMVEEMFKLVIKFPLEIFQSLLFALMSLLAMIASFYLTITFVHTKYITKHRIFIGIALYVGVSILLGFILDSTMILNILYNIPYNFIIWMDILLSTIAFGVCYMGTVYLLDHKIQVE